MGIFTRRINANEFYDKLYQAVQDAITQQLRDIDTIPKLTVKIETLKKAISQLEINRDKKQEEFDRKEREIEHKVGLIKEQQEFELRAAKQEALLDVREENLKKDVDRFEQQMKFQQERFEKEVGYLKDIMQDILKRLPNVSASFERTNKDES